MSTIRNIILSLAILSVGLVFAQQSNVDSILQVISQEKIDTSKVKLYRKLGDIFMYSNADSSIFYNKKALNLAIKSKSDKYIAKSYMQLGINYGIKGAYEESLHFFNEALKINRKINNRRDEAACLSNIALVNIRQSNYNEALVYLKEALIINDENNDIKKKAKNLSNIGVVYSEKGQYDIAIEYYQKALKIYEKLKDERSILNDIYGNIAVLFMQQNNNDKAIEFLDKAIQIAKKNNDLNSLGISYINLGIIYSDKLEFDKAIEYYQKALKSLRKVGNDYAINSLYNNLGSIYQQMGDNNKALEYYKQSLDIAERIGDKAGVARATSNIASNYNKLEQYHKALPFAEKSLKVAKKTDGLEEQKNAYKHLSTTHKGLKNYKKALEYKLLEIQLKDSLFNIEKTEKINEIQTKYETEKKDLEIINKNLEIDNLKKKEQRNKIIVFASTLVLGLGILALILYYKNRLTKEKYRAEMFNQKLLRSQMNPHFIFNTLTSIQSYMFEKDTKKAAMYLSSFAKLTRSILDGSRHDFVSLQEDYETNESYLKIQQMRYNYLFDYSIKIDENIDPDSVQIAPMLIQPFIENSIIHGFKDIDYKGYLEIIYKKLGNKIEITIQDNGKGVANDKEHGHKSHALSITKERLSILNKRSKDKISFKVENANEKGYKVVFNVPLKVA